MTLSPDDPPTGPEGGRPRGEPPAPGTEEPLDGLVEHGLRELFEAARRGEDSARFGHPRRDVPGTAGPPSARGDARAAGAGAGDAPPPAEIPERIGRYRILGEVARGGVGAILHGRDDALGRDVAVKVLLGEHSERPGMSERLVAEAQVAGQLEHPGVVAVHELGTDAGGRPYLVMKLVRGRTLAAQLAERTSPAADTQQLLAVFESIAQALAHAHTRGVVHRDLKPLNIMVGAFGEVQVMDWGLAKVLHTARGDGPGTAAPPAPPAEAAGAAQGPDVPAPPHGTIHTVRSSSEQDRSLAGSVLGTPAYMAPEQARGDVDAVDTRTDVFGLGAILCEILTGAPPYRGATTLEVLGRARRGELRDAVERLRSTADEPELADLARRCLAPDPEERPADAGVVAEAVTRHRQSLEERARAARLEAAEARIRAQSERKTRRLVAALGVLATATAVGGTALLFWLHARSEQRALSTERLIRRSMDEARGMEAAAEPGDTTAIAAAVRAARAATELASERSGEVTSALAGKAEGLLRALEERHATAGLITRLEGIHQQSGLTRPGHPLDAAADTYEAAFTDHFGEAWETMPVEEAARRVRATGAAAEVARYLLLRAVREKRHGADGTESWKRPVRIADLADPDPLRRRLRKAFAADDEATLREIARSPALEDASALTFHALAVAASGALADDEELLRIWRRARDLRPGDFWINRGLGRALRDAHPPQLEEARRWLTAAVALRPESALARATLATVERRRRRHDVARRILHEALELEPESAIALNSLGAVLLDTGDLAGAETAFRRALELDSLPGESRARTLANLGVLYVERGEVPEGRRLFERALALEPATPVAHNGIGWLLYERGRRGEALAHFRRATESSHPGSASWKNLGQALLETGDPGGAVRALERAIELDREYSLACDLLARAHRERGDAAAAVRAYTRSIEIDPQGPVAPSELLDLLDTTDLPPLEDELDELLSVLDAIAGSSDPLAGTLGLLYVTAWCAHPDPERRAQAVRLAETIHRGTGGSNPTVLATIAPLRFLCGDPREAVRSLEKAVRLGWPRSRAGADLERFRAAVEPDLPTFASVEAAVDALPGGLDRAAARAHFASFREAASGEDAPARIAYLEALLAERDGRREEALSRLRELVRSGPWPPEPYLRLWRVLRASGDPAAALGAFHAALETASLPPRPLPVPPLRPALSLAEGPAADGAAALSSPSFRTIDPRVEHAATRWQVWIEGSDPALEPLVDVVDSEAPERFSIPAGTLLPGVSLRARAAHIGSDGRTSSWSDAIAFGTGDLALETVPFDLADLADRDVVAAPGDAEDDAFDTTGYRLVVDGFDGSRRDAGSVRGLPRDGRVLCHRLLPYDRRNAFGVAAGTPAAPVRLEVPGGRYTALRFLVAGANGSSLVPVVLELPGGDTRRLELPCPDWFDDPGDERLDSLAPRPVPVRNGMDRLRGTTLEEADDAALFEVVLELEETPEVGALTFDLPGARFSGTDTRFVLFAITGVRKR